MSKVVTAGAPLAGTIESIDVNLNDFVKVGDLLLIMESMKVHVQVKAEHAGKVVAIKTTVGSTVKLDQALIKISAGAKDTASNESAAVTKQVDAPEHLPTLEEFKQRRDLSLDAARITARDKRHAKGYLTARENLALLCSPDEFQEYGQLAVAAQRQRIDYETLKITTAADGIITGLAPVNADLFGADPVNNIETALVINDYSVLAGTQGFYHHQKLDRMLAIAGKRKLPVIMYCEGGGGRPGDTDVTVVNSGLNCRSFGTWAGLAGVVPRIAVANGYNFAGNAALFGAADITIATEKSWVGMAGPAMIEGGGLGVFKPTDIGPIGVQSSNGVVDIVASDETQAADLAKQALAYFQGDLNDWTAPDNEALRAILPSSRRMTYPIRALIEHIADQHSFLELKPNYGGAIVTGFVRIEGKAIGIMASDCAILGGAIDVAAGEKAAEFMQLCNDFAMPIVSLCDTPGFMVGPEHEESGAVRRLAKLFTAGAKCTVPLISVVIRKCYGLGAQAMLGGSTMSAHYTVSWPSGEFGPMGLEGAVKLGFKKELAAVDNEEARAKLFDKLLDQQYKNGQAIEVASTVEIDAVIDPADTRKVIAAILT